MAQKAKQYFRLLKMVVFLNTDYKRFTCKTIVPSVVKKLATGKGNADKQNV